MRSISRSVSRAVTGVRRFRRVNLPAWLVLVGVAAFSLSAKHVSAQSQAQLERRRIALTKRIVTTGQLLQDSRRTRVATVAQLEGVERQVAQRQSLLDVLQLQLAHVDSSLGRTETLVSSMQADIDTLSAEYGRMVRAALRQQLLRGRSAYLLSADGLGDAMRRIRYLRRYDEYRRRQLDLITQTRDALAGKAARLDEVRAAKQQLYDEAVEQQVLLQAELLEKERLVKELQGDEARLRAELTEQQADKAQLDGAIAEVIEAATTERKRRVAAKAPAAEPAPPAATRAPNEITATPPKPPVAAPVRTTDYSTALAADFAKNRGRLPLPVARGFVSKPFGKRAHPTLPKVQVNNNGVDIRTDAGAEVHAVFEGKVVGIQQVPGYQTMVIVQHGDYYTVYSRLEDVRVKAGAQVGTAEVLGRVASASSAAASELHFEVWRAKETLNPVRWVRGL